MPMRSSLQAYREAREIPAVAVRWVRSQLPDALWKSQETAAVVRLCRQRDTVNARAAASSSDAAA